jgi:hypothetical protein
MDVAESNSEWHQVRTAIAAHYSRALGGTADVRDVSLRLSAATALPVVFHDDRVSALAVHAWLREVARACTLFDSADERAKAWSTRGWALDVLTSLGPLLVEVCVGRDGLWGNMRMEDNCKLEAAVQDPVDSLAAMSAGIDTLNASALALAAQLEAEYNLYPAGASATVAVAI